jgi:hypothetical protein
MAQGTTKGVPIDVDPTLAADSDLLVPSQKAIKTYVDTNFLNPSDLSATTPLTYSSSTGVFTINQASSSSNGFLSSTDWSNFNSKIGVSKSFLLGNHGASTVATGVTSYGGFVKNLLTTAAQAYNVRTVMPEACTLRNWSVYVGAQPATGSLVFTMRLDLVDTAYTITVAAFSATGVYQNTSGSLSVPAQGILEYKITNNAATSSGAIVAVSVTAEI